MPLKAPVSPPPLREGDRMTSDEFLRRWEAMPELKHAELIDGVVYMPSPVSQPHSDFHILLAFWLRSYETDTPGCHSGLDSTWLMGERNTPQPDLALRVLPDFGGQSRAGGDYPLGAPELVVEVAVSSAAHDLGAKFHLYQRQGVLEYLVALVGEKRFAWYEWIKGAFRTLELGTDGILRSRCFPGLWLDAEAFWRLDGAGVRTVLEQGLATPEHAAFVAGLASQKK